MYLRQHNRNATGKAYQGPGGRHCVCCDNNHKHNPKMRRYMRRVEKQGWKRELV